MVGGVVFLLSHIKRTKLVFKIANWPPVDESPDAHGRSPVAQRLPPAALMEAAGPPGRRPRPGKEAAERGAENREVLPASR